jgi:hypothetical protein
LGGQSVGAEFDRTIVELSEAQVSCEAPDCEKKNNRWNIAYQLEIDTTGLDTTDFNVEKDTGTL